MALVELIKVPTSASVYASVAAAQADANIKTGATVITQSTVSGMKYISEWRVQDSAASAPDYTVPTSNGKYLKLQPQAVMNYAEFGFGVPGAAAGTTNSDAFDAALAFARKYKNIVGEMQFPKAVVYVARTLKFDVDSRGFKFTGPGWDAAYIISQVTGTGYSMEHVGIDPRDRAQDRNHQYQELSGFTIDGNSTAFRAVCYAHYPLLGFKTVGHTYSNCDITGLVARFYGMTQARAVGSSGDGTRFGLRCRYNSIKILDGAYIGGWSTRVGLQVHGPATTMPSANAVGDTTITVASASEFMQYDIVEILGAAETLEAKYIVGVSGNVLTLDSALTTVHPAGSRVYCPVFGTSIGAITHEVGQLQIGNCDSVSASGAYIEKSRVYFFNTPKAVKFDACSILQGDIRIDQVTRESSISIKRMRTAFSTLIECASRSGVVNAYLDVWNMPLLDIDGLSRAENSILLNNTYSLQSLKVERDYFNSDQMGRSMSFSGLTVAAPEATAAFDVLMVVGNSTGSYNSYTWDIKGSIRHLTGSYSGLVHGIAGTTYNGSASVTQDVRTAYPNYNASTGLYITFGAGAGKHNLVMKPAPSGGGSVVASFSGTVKCMYPG